MYVTVFVSKIHAMQSKGWAVGANWEGWAAIFAGRNHQASRPPCLNSRDGTTEAAE